MLCDRFRRVAACSVKVLAAYCACEHITEPVPNQACAFFFCCVCNFFFFVSSPFFLLSFLLLFFPFFFFTKGHGCVSLLVL